MPHGKGEWQRTAIRSQKWKAMIKKALQRRGMWKEQAKIRERTRRIYCRREVRVGKGTNENSAMKTWVKARMKRRNLISLVVFIVDKETNSVHQVNYSVNSSIFFSTAIVTKWIAVQIFPERWQHLSHLRYQNAACWIGYYKASWKYVMIKILQTTDNREVPYFTPVNSIEKRGGFS